MLRRTLAVLALIAAAAVGGLNCNQAFERTFERHEEDSGALAQILWVFVGFSYGTDYQPSVETLQNGKVVIVPAQDPSVTISPTGQMVAASVRTPATSAVVRTLYAPDSFSKGILVLDATGLRSSLL